jgi:signal peptidase I
MTHWIKHNRGFLIFLLCFGFFRTAVADWNPIPSGSMRPTLLEGDVVLVNRLAYDFKIPLTDVPVARLAEPQRGDVVTFTSPVDGMRLIKRLVGLPGDVVEMRDGVLIVNGAAADYSDFEPVVEPLAKDVAVAGLRATERIAGHQRIVQFLPGVEARRNMNPMVVPAEAYFFLGDSRDNSVDSRYLGVVLRHLLIGRAHRIVVSADILDAWVPRVGRTGQRIE